MARERKLTTGRLEIGVEPVDAVCEAVPPPPA